MIRLRLHESLDDPQFASEFQVSAYRILFIILYAMYFNVCILLYVYFTCVCILILLFFVLHDTQIINIILNFNTNYK